MAEPNPQPTAGATVPAYVFPIALNTDRDDSASPIDHHAVHKSATDLSSDSPHGALPPNTGVAAPAEVSAAAAAGRYAIASRDIAPGEVVLAAAPYVMVPSLRAAPSALHLLRRCRLEASPPLPSLAPSSFLGAAAASTITTTAAAASATTTQAQAHAQAPRYLYENLNQTTHGAAQRREEREEVEGEEPYAYTATATHCASCQSVIAAGSLLVNFAALRRLSVDMSVEWEARERQLFARACRQQRRQQQQQQLEKEEEKAAAATAAATNASAGGAKGKTKAKAGKDKKGGSGGGGGAKMRSKRGLELEEKMREKFLLDRELFVERHKMECRRARQVQENEPTAASDNPFTNFDRRHIIIQGDADESRVTSATRLLRAHGFTMAAGCEGCGLVSYCSPECFARSHPLHASGGECAAVRAVLFKLMELFLYQSRPQAAGASNSSKSHKEKRANNAKGSEMSGGGGGDGGVTADRIAGVSADVLDAVSAAAAAAARGIGGTTFSKDDGKDEDLHDVDYDDDVYGEGEGLEDADGTLTAAFLAARGISYMPGEEVTRYWATQASAAAERELQAALLVAQVLGKMAAEGFASRFGTTADAAAAEAPHTSSSSSPPPLPSSFLPSSPSALASQPPTGDTESGGCGDRQEEQKKNDTAATDTAPDTAAAAATTTSSTSSSSVGAAYLASLPRGVREIINIRRRLGASEVELLDEDEKGLLPSPIFNMDNKSNNNNNSGESTVKGKKSTMDGGGGGSEEEEGSIEESTQRSCMELFIQSSPSNGTAGSGLMSGWTRRETAADNPASAAEGGIPSSSSSSPHATSEGAYHLPQHVCRLRVPIPTYSDMARMITNYSVIDKEDLHVYRRAYRTFAAHIFPVLRPTLQRLHDAFVQRQSCGVCEPDRETTCPENSSGDCKINNNNNNKCQNTRLVIDSISEEFFLRLCGVAQCNSFGIYIDGSGRAEEDSGDGGGGVFNGRRTSPTGTSSSSSPFSPPKKTGRGATSSAAASSAANNNNNHNNNNNVNTASHDEDRLVAFGIYPLASYFNHSCYPNLCRVVNNNNNYYYSGYDVDNTAESAGTHDMQNEETRATQAPHYQQQRHQQGGENEAPTGKKRDNEKGRQDDDGVIDNSSGNGGSVADERTLRLSLSSYYRAPRTTHSCALFFALRPISRGEPLCICYASVEEPSTAERRRALLRNFRFHCECPRCGTTTTSTTSTSAACQSAAASSNMADVCNSDANHDAATAASGEATPPLPPDVLVAAAAAKEEEEREEDTAPAGVKATSAAAAAATATTTAPAFKYLGGKLIKIRDIELCDRCAVRGYLRPLPPLSRVVSGHRKEGVAETKEVEEEEVLQIKECTVCGHRVYARTAAVAVKTSE